MQVYNEDGTEYLADLTADDGSPIKVLIAKDMPVTDEMQEPFTHAVKTGETRLGLRYQHCLVVECAYLRREVNRMTLDCETP